jgi:uncharacterized protein
MGRPVHFEIHADDPERARAFYQTVFGWEIERWGEQEYWVITTGTASPGINGGLLKRPQAGLEAGAPVNGSVLTSEVEDIDATISTVTSNGGQVALEKQAMPGIGTVAYFLDTENNVFGALQPEAGGDPA